jgi:hypothetical protein
VNSQLQYLKTARQRLKEPAWVTPEALNVAPELLDAQLAKPARRLLAIGIDLALIGILSGANSLWLVAGLALMLLQFRKKQTTTTSSQRKLMVWALCIGFLWLGAQHGKNFWEDQQDEDTPAVAAKQARQAAKKAAAKAASAQALKGDANEQTAPAATLASAPASAPAAGPSDAERIAQLEQELEEARNPKVFRWRDQAKRWLDGLGLGFGWAIVYFSLLPAWLQGQTLGKKLLGLRVVELTGKPLNVMTCFSRYGGYAAGMATGMATGMMGFAQVLWDVNHQAIQDKIAHTVVIDLRAPRPLQVSRLHGTDVEFG